MRIDFGNVQGMIVHLYRRPIVRYLLFGFGGAPGARTFLRQLLDRVLSAALSEDVRVTAAGDVRNG